MCNCQTIGDAHLIKTAPNKLHKSAEGRKIDECIFYGGIVMFISKEGANYFVNSYSSFALKHFRTLIKVGDDEMEFPKNGLEMKWTSKHVHPCTIDWSRIMAIKPY